MRLCSYPTRLLVSVLLLFFALCYNNAEIVTHSSSGSISSSHSRTSDSGSSSSSDRGSGIGKQHPRGRSRKILHLVITRFQQYQPALLPLGQARVHLFNTFCYPSIRQQSTQNFIWLILTDPLLHTSLRDQMVHILSPHANYFLLPRLGFLTSEPFLAGNMSGQEIWTGRFDYSCFYSYSCCLFCCTTSTFNICI